LLVVDTRMLWQWPFHPTYSFLTTEVHVNVFTIHGHTVFYSYIVSRVQEVHSFSCFDCLVEVGESIDKRTPLWHHNLALSARSWRQLLSNHFCNFFCFSLLMEDGLWNPGVLVEILKIWKFCDGGGAAERGLEMAP